MYIRLIVAQNLNISTKIYRKFIIIVLMQKQQEIKSKRSFKKQITKIPSKKQKLIDKYQYQASHSNYQININCQKQRRQDEKLNNIKQNPQKYKKIRYITQDIEKSSEDALLAHLQNHRKECTLKISSLNNLEDLNIQQRCKSTKKQQKSSAKNKNFDKIRENERLSLNTANIKIRGLKSHSKSHKQLNLKALKAKNKSKSKSKQKQKSNKKQKPKSARGHKDMAEQNKFLSPQVAQLQNSYYFSNFSSISKNESRDGIMLQKRMVTEPTLNIPKKANMFIYESKQSVWKKQNQKGLKLGSTRDLLN